MKISIDIECSPEEARRFMGLPDISALNEELVSEMGEKLRESLASKDAEDLFRDWMASGVKGMEQLQKAFWEQFSAPDEDKGKR